MGSAPVRGASALVFTAATSIAFLGSEPRTGCRDSPVTSLHAGTGALDRAVLQP